MKIPTVDSQVKVRVRYSQGPKMFPPQPDFIEYTGKVVKPYKWVKAGEFCITGDKNFPIRVIAVENVTDLQLISGSTKDVPDGVQVFNVKGSKGDSYNVTRANGSYTCTCQGFQWRKSCKHITSVASK